MEHKALIIRPGALGDTLMLLPALKDLENNTGITVVVREPGISFLRKAGFHCIDMEGGGWHRLFQERPDPRQRLPVSPQDRVVAYLADSDGTIRRNLKDYFPGAAIHVFPAYPEAEDEIHVAGYLCETLAGAGLPVDPGCAMERARNRPLLRGGSESGPKRGIVVHPGSGSPRKNLSPELWLAFLERISEEPVLQNPGKGVVLLGPAEEGLRDFFGKRVPRTLETVFYPRDEELVSLLGTAHIYAGHDSGVTHLAAMLGTPTLALFRQDNLSMWHPLGPATRIVHSLKPNEADLKKMVEAARILIRSACP